MQQMRQGVVDHADHQMDKVRARAYSPARGLSLSRYGLHSMAQLATTVVRHRVGTNSKLHCTNAHGMLGIAVPVCNLGVVMVQLLGCISPTELQLCPLDLGLASLVGHAFTLHTVDLFSYSQAHTNTHDECIGQQLRGTASSTAL